MEINIVKVGMLETNCYIIEKDNKCLVIDPGGEFNKIKDNIKLELVGILLTHRHFDHIGALEDIVKYFNVPVYDRNKLIEGTNKVNDFQFKVKYNPGHTFDSISFIFDDIMFSGDFIFERCIGRCDLGGDYNLMLESIKEILNSKIDYIIYPGHGDSTTLSKERSMLESYIK